MHYDVMHKFVVSKLRTMKKNGFLDTLKFMNDFRTVDLRVCW